MANDTFEEDILDTGEQTDGEAQDGGGEAERHAADKGQSDAEVRAELAQAKKDRDEFRQAMEQNKRELAETREHFSRVGSALAGVGKSREELANEAKVKQVRESLKTLYPWFEEAEKQFTTRKEGAETPQSSLAEMRYYNDAKEAAFAHARKMGFTSNEGQQGLAVLGDVLINNVPAWKERFHKNGDLSVVTEVGKYLEEKVFGPYTKSIKAQVVADLKRRGLLVRDPNPQPGAEKPKGPTPPAPPRKPVQREATPDLNDPRQRLSGLTQLASSIINGGEE